MKSYNVVAAVICDAGEYLCVQRGQTRYGYTAYKYEFPGGKVEQGETEEHALLRELLEEMDYPVTIERKLCDLHHEYPDFAVTLHFYLCHPADTEHPRRFRLNEHISACWLPACAMSSLPWVAADLPLIELLQKTSAS